jgi:hypothetical protein
MNAQPSIENNVDNSRPWVAGLILILIGTLALAGQFIQTVWYPALFLGAVGVVFLTSGLLTRKNGLLIPGGILAGLGLGVVAQGWAVDRLPDFRGGLFIVGFAAGWALISLLSLVNRQWMGWPLIPAAILGAVGAALVAGGTFLVALRLLGTYGWPLILIGLGALLLLRRK